MESIRQELKHFLEVARAGSFTKAADRLGCGQPLLSKSVRKLELELKVKLFTRTSTGITPTRSGELFLRQLQNWIAQWEGIESELRQQRREIAGSFSIGCHATVGMDALPRFLPALLSEYPDLEFKVVHQSSKQVTEDVLAFKVDFGIVISPLPFPDLVMLPLRREPVCVWTAKRATPLNTLNSKSCVLFLNPELIGGTALLEQTLKKGDPIERLIPINSYEVIAELVSSGAGIGIFPEQVGSRNDRLKRLEFEGAKLEHALYLIYRKDFQNTAASQTILQSIRNSLKVDGFNPKS